MSYAEGFALSLFIVSKISLCTFFLPLSSNFDHSYFFLLGDDCWDALPMFVDTGCAMSRAENSLQAQI